MAGPLYSVIIIGGGAVATAVAKKLSKKISVLQIDSTLPTNRSGLWHTVTDTAGLFTYANGLNTIETLGRMRYCGKLVVFAMDADSNSDVAVDLETFMLQFPEIYNSAVIASDSITPVACRAVTYAADHFAKTVLCVKEMPNAELAATLQELEGVSVLSNSYITAVEAIAPFKKAVTLNTYTTVNAEAVLDLSKPIASTNFLRGRIQLADNGKIVIDPSGHAAPYLSCFAIGPVADRTLTINQLISNISKQLGV